VAQGKEAAKNAIHEVLTSLKQFLAQETPPKLSEADTKVHFIDPVITALGWVGIASVAREYYVKNSQEFIDYVMRDGGKLLLAIEAKALQVHLTEKAAAQLVQYCVVEGVEWAALANGRELWFYNTFIKGDLATKLIFRLDLLAFNSDAEYEALFEQLWLLSRASMTTQAGLRTWLEHHRMDQALRTVLFNPASPILRALQDYLTEQDIKAGVADIVQWFRSLVAPNVLPMPLLHKQPEKLSVAEKRSSDYAYKPAHTPASPSTVKYYLLPVAGWGKQTSMEHLQSWLDRGIWGMGKSTAGRKHFRPGDSVCFYATGFGVVAIAKLAGLADTPLEDDDVPGGPPKDTLYRVPLAGIEWLASPIAITKAVRANLDILKGKPIDAAWGWVVQSTCRLSEHDYHLLVGHLKPQGVGRAG
jgi:hypothetical protein